MKKTFTNPLYLFLRYSVNLLFIFILLFSYTNSQTYTIQGRILTGNTPVSYASITFIDQNDTSKKYAATTDSYGEYNLSIITSVENGNPVLPKNIQLEQNYPNPFAKETAIQYRLNKQSDVRIKIFNILGQAVKTFKIGIQPNGVYRIKWDGRNNFGNKVSPGIYFYQLHTFNEAYVKKMVFSGEDVLINFPFGIPSSSSLAKDQNEINLPKSETFTVRIENREDTEPKIQLTEFSNVIIQNDTTLDFEVQQSEQWKFLGLENETVTAIAVNPADPDIIYAGTLYDFSAGINGKLFKSKDGGNTWDTLLIGGGYSEILIAPTNPDRIYALPGSIIKSDDAGKTWQTIIKGIFLDPETRLQSLAMNPLDPDILYAGTVGFFGGTLYKSYNGGLEWNDIGHDSLRGGVISIAIDPADTNIVYAGTADIGVLWKSTDAGNTWFRSGLGETGQFILDILVHSEISNYTIYAGISRMGIFKSEDSGITWEMFSQGLPADFSVMKIQAYNSSRLFIIGSSPEGSGVYEYSYQSNKWIKIGIDELSLISMHSDLEISSNPGRIYFGSIGIYVMDLK